MLSTFDFTLALLSLGGQDRTARRMHATVQWVRASCEADCLPEWLTAMVVANVERELLSAAGHAPMVEVEK